MGRRAGMARKWTQLFHLSTMTGNHEVVEPTGWLGHSSAEVHSRVQSDEASLTWLRAFGVKQPRSFAFYFSASVYDLGPYWHFRRDETLET
jgi:hypothetical protein